MQQSTKFILKQSNEKRLFIMEYLLIGLNLEQILLHESVKGKQCNIIHPSNYVVNASRNLLTVDILNFITDKNNRVENIDLL